MIKTGMRSFPFSVQYVDTLIYPLIRDGYYAAMCYCEAPGIVQKRRNRWCSATDASPTVRMECPSEAMRFHLPSVATRCTHMP